MLSAHCHDDLGLAVANSLAAVEAGARQVECTVNGIGERAGNASLEEIVMALRVRGDALGVDTDIDVAQIGPPAARCRGSRYSTAEQGDRRRERVRARSRHPPGRVAQGRATYQIIDPKELGLAMTLPLGKHSGRHAFSQACAEAGMKLDEERPAVAFMRFKARADTGRHVSLDESSSR